MLDKMKKKKSQRRTTRSLRDKVLAFTLALCMLVPNASMVVNAKDTSSGTKDTYVEASSSPAAIGELETNPAKPATAPAGEAEESIESGQQPESATAPDAVIPESDTSTPAPDTPASEPDAAASEPDASGENSDLPSPAVAPAESTSDPASPAAKVPEGTAEGRQTPQPLNTDGTLYKYEYSVNGGPAKICNDIWTALDAMEGSTDYTKSYIKIMTGYSGYSNGVITTNDSFTLDLNDMEMNFGELNIKSGTVRLTGGPNSKGIFKQVGKSEVYNPAMIRVTGTGHFLLDGATIDCADSMEQYGSTGVICEGRQAVAEVNGTISNISDYFSLQAVNGGTLKVTGGTYRWISLISEGYGYPTSKVYLSGNPAVGNITMERLGEIYANDGGNDPKYFLPDKPCTIQCEQFNMITSELKPGIILAAGVANENVFKKEITGLISDTTGLEARTPDTYPGNITLQKRPKTLTAIGVDISKCPEFYAGSYFDPTNMKVYAKYADATQGVLKPGEYRIVEGADVPFEDKIYQHFIRVEYTEGDITVKGHSWKRVIVSRTLTYDTDGGTPIAPTTAWGDAYHTEPTPPTKPGYTFKYWFIIEGRDEEVPVDIKTKHFTENTTVKAKWEALPISKISIATPPDKTVYKIGEPFDKTGMVVNAVYSDGSKVEVTDYTTSIGNNQLTADDTSITITYKSFTATQDITVKLPFNVTFDVDGGKGTYDTQKVFIDEYATKPTTDPTKSGYDFEYWYKNGETTEFDFTSTPITTDTVIKAKWVDKTAPTAPDIKYFILSGSGEWYSFNTGKFCNTHFNKDINIKFSSDDKGSKVKSFTYTLADGTVQTIDAADGKATITIQGPYLGCITEVYAEDNAGNKSTVSSTPYFVIDKEDPIGAITVDTGLYTPGQWSDVPVSLTVSGASAASGINRYEYSTDNGINWYGTMAIDTTPPTSTTPMTVNKAMITFNESEDFTIIFRAVSNASNISDNSTGTLVKVDTVAPKFTLAGNTTDYVVKDTITLKDVIAYSGITMVEVKKDDGEYTEITDTYADGYEVTENGTYTFKVTNTLGKVTENFITYTKIDPRKPVLTIDSNGYEADTWVNSDITLTVTNTVDHGKIEYQIGDGEWTEYKSPIVINADCDATTYSFKATSGAGVESDVSTFVVKRDTVLPTGDITFNENSVKKVLSSITFNLFFKETVDVSIVSEDDLSYVAKTEYYKSAEALTEAEVNAIEEKDWVEGTSLSLTPTDKETFIIYVRITDHAGNITLFGSDGSTFDTTAPAIEGVNEGISYYVTQEVTVTDDNLDKITLDGEVVSNPVTLAGDTDKSYIIETTDKAGNSSALTVTMKPISELSTSIGSLTVDTVTSDNKEVITVAKAPAAAISLAHATQNEQAAIKEMLDKCDSLLKRIEDTATENKRITDTVGDYSENTVTSADQETIEALKTAANTLLAGANLTEGERASLTATVTAAGKLTTKIETTVTEINRIVEEIKKYPENTVTFANKAAIDKLKADTNILLAATNLTDKEREELTAIVALSKTLVDKIEAEECIRITDAAKEYPKEKVATVTSADKAAIEILKKDAETLIADNSLTEKEREDLNSIVETTVSLLDKIEATAKENKRIIEAVANYFEDTVTSADQETVVELKTAADTLLAGQNLTADERTALTATADAAGKLVTKLETTAKEINRIAEEIKKYPEDKVVFADKGAIDKLNADAKKLLAGTNLTDKERKDLTATVALSKDLVDKIEAAENKRITDIAKDYPKEKVDTVTSADKVAIEKLKKDTDTLLADNSLTEKECEDLKAIVNIAVSLIEKIEATAAENIRITDAVKAYSENTVTSSDQETIKVLKEDAQKLLAGKNLTTDEIESLTEIVATTDSLLNKIEVTAKEIKDVTDAVKAYSEDKVTSADKATIETLKADAKKLLDGTNITDKEREDLIPIADTAKALTDKIDAVTAENKRITDGVNAYSETTVTSADQETIETFKADANTLLGGTNLTKDEITDLTAIIAITDALVTKIAATAAENKRITDAVMAYSKDTVVFADKAKLDELRADAKKLLDGTNLTEKEREDLTAIEALAKAFVDQIEAEECSRITEKINKYSMDTVTSADKAEINQLNQDAVTLLEDNSFAEEVLNGLTAIAASGKALIDKIDEVTAENNRIADAVKIYEENTITSADKAAIEQLKADAQILLDGSNITDKEREDLTAILNTTVSLINKIEATAAENNRITDAVKAYSEDKVTSADKETIEGLKAAANILLAGKNLTANEITSLTTIVAATDSLLNKIEATVKEIIRIADELKKYPENAVTFADKAKIEKIKGDANILLAGTNLTDKEREDLTAIVVLSTALVDKIEEAECTRITDAAKEYSKEKVDTVTSADLEAIEEIKTDATTLLADNSLTEEEREGLKEIVATTDLLLEKIKATATESERISAAVNNYSEDKVTSADKESIEVLKADANQLLKGKNLTTDEVKSLTAIVATTDSLLNKISATAKAIKDVTDAVKAYSAAEVTSANQETIEGLKADADKLLEGTNIIDKERQDLTVIVNTTVALIEKIEATATENKRITDAVKAYSETTVTSADQGTIEALKAAANTLLAGKNLTDDERKGLTAAVTDAGKLVTKIETTAKEINRIAEELKKYPENKVTFADKGAIDKLKADAKKLLDGTNLTNKERQDLTAIVTLSKALVDKIEEAECNRIIVAAKAYPKEKLDTVTSADKTAIEKNKTDANKLLADNSLIEKERDNLKEIVNTADLHIEKIEATVTENNRITTAVNKYAEEKVTSADKETIKALKAAADILLAGKNLTEDERKNLTAMAAAAGKLITKIETTAKEIIRIADEIKKYPEDKVIFADKGAIDKLNADAKKLLAGTNLTDKEREDLTATVALSKTLVDKIEAAENKRITDVAKDYSKDKVKTVTSADKAAIEKLKKDTDTLLADNSLTEKECEDLKAIVKTADSLIEKIKATATEKNRITTAVNIYAEEKVTSADKDAIEELKADANILLAGQNLTADERKSLTDLVTAAGKLVTKIDNTAKEINRIAAEIKKYPENTVTFANKAAIDKLKADTKKLLNGTNITTKERKDLTAIESSSKALVDKIEAQESKRITDAAKQYSNDTITSADKAAIEKLKADAQILLDGNNLTKDENKALVAITERVDSLIKTIETVEKAAVPDSYNKVKDINNDNVSFSNQGTLEKAKADLEKTLKDFGKNYTAEETASLNAKISQVDGALKALENVNSTIKAIEQLPAPEAVKSENRDSILAANMLYDSLTAHEKSLISREASQKLTKVCTALANQQLNNDTTGIKIEAVGDTALDPNTELVVAPLKPDETQAQNVEAAAKGSKIVSLFDISLFLNAAKIQPNGMVRITLTINEEELKNFKDFKVVYIDDNGVVTILPSTVSGGKIQFDTNHFSCYGIIGSPVAEATPTPDVTPSDKPGTTPGANSSVTPSSTKSANQSAAPGTAQSGKSDIAKNSATSADTSAAPNASKSAKSNTTPNSAKSAKFSDVPSDKPSDTLTNNKATDDFSMLQIIIIIVILGGAVLLFVYRVRSEGKHER